MKKLVLITIMIAATFIWYGLEGKSVKATTGSETSSDMPATNFTGADLTGANLGGVSLNGVILCNTTMPDGTINNTSCKN
ncbi:MAG: pentapeptide repeat-containing protein [Nitrospinae bacterium]|nr:pentapeptide repeat-containing protein [Nitrospinota bacterium]